MNTPSPTTTKRRRHTQTQVRGAVRGAIEAGLTVSRIEFDVDGKLVLICGDALPPATQPGDFEARLRDAARWAR